jgi:hypothetical protein
MVFVKRLPFNAVGQICTIFYSGKAVGLDTYGFSRSPASEVKPIARVGKRRFARKGLSVGFYCLNSDVERLAIAVTDESCPQRRSKQSQARERRS